MGVKCRMCIEKLSRMFADAAKGNITLTFDWLDELKAEGCISEELADSAEKLLDQLVSKWGISQGIEEWRRSVIFDFADSISKECQREKE